MANPLFNRFGNVNNTSQTNNSNKNILFQLAQLKRDPGSILDIMLSNGKINQQQYNDLQRYRGNPEMICKYLINNGKANEINNAEHIVNQIKP